MIQVPCMGNGYVLNFNQIKIYIGLAKNSFRVYISSSFLVIGSEYFDIFFMDLTLKSDKNLDLTVKNSSLYKLKLTITLPNIYILGPER